MIVHDSDKEVKENKERLQLNGGANTRWCLFFPVLLFFTQDCHKCAYPYLFDESRIIF